MKRRSRNAKYLTHHVPRLVFLCAQRIAKYHRFRLVPVWLTALFRLASFYHADTGLSLSISHLPTALLGDWQRLRELYRNLYLHDGTECAAGRTS